MRRGHPLHVKSLVSIYSQTEATRNTFDSKTTLYFTCSEDNMVDSDVCNLVLALPFWGYLMDLHDGRRNVIACLRQDTAAPSYADSPKMIPLQCNFHATTRSSTMTPLTLPPLFQHDDRVLPAKLPRLRFTSSSAKATSLLQPPHQTTWGLHPRTPASASRPGLSASSALRLLIRASLCRIKF